MERIYYIVVNNAQQGPFSKEELKIKTLSPETLVWRAGMPQWVKLADFPELADILPIDVTNESADISSDEDNGWYAMLGERRLGPATVSELIALGVDLHTPVWHAGMADWANASSQPDFVEAVNSNNPPRYDQSPNNHYSNFSQNPQFGQQPNFAQNTQYGQQTNFGQNPQYGQQPNYGQNTQYSRNQFNNQQYGGPVHTNWLPWAIGATVVGFLFSCIGAIFGIIGIVQANKANGLYTAGFEGEADQANNTAKVMTIIAYVLAGVGLISSFVFFKNFSLYNYM